MRTAGLPVLGRTVRCTHHRRTRSPLAYPPAEGACLVREDGSRRVQAPTSIGRTLSWLFECRGVAPAADIEGSGHQTRRGEWAGGTSLPNVGLFGAGSDGRPPTSELAPTRRDGGDADTSSSGAERAAAPLRAAGVGDGTGLARPSLPPPCFVSTRRAWARPAWRAQGHVRCALAPSPLGGAAHV